MGTQNQAIEPSPPRLRGRVARSRSIGTKLTPEEERRILAAAEAVGKAPSEWARDLLLDGVAATVRDETEMHIFTELVGLQMLLMGALDPLLRGPRNSSPNATKRRRRCNACCSTLGKKRVNVTLQAGGRPLPLQLAVQEAKSGSFFLVRGPLARYSNKPLHAWLGRSVYGSEPIYKPFASQLWVGLAVFGLLLPISIPKDIARTKELRYGRRLKGPFLVSSKGFTKAVFGDGIGITTDDSRRPLRIPRDAENKHFLIVGDTGSGKSSIIRQMLYQVDARGDSAIVYDPACEFVKQFYDVHRRHRAQSTRCADAVLESIKRASPQGGSEGSGGVPVSAGGGHEPLLRRGSTENLRPSSDLPAHADGACPVDVRSR
jgi:Type IV secretion-system coupling protein DNA-binding domain